MKEFIWKICCLIWHFDDRVIKEYKEKELEALKKLENKYWIDYQKHLKSFEDLESHHIDINEDNFVPFHYGVTIANANCYEQFWNNIYNKVFVLGYELGKEEELKELRKQRQEK